ncbi:CBS domain-containing protein [Saccharopolyspora sp. NPDC000995]
MQAGYDMSRPVVTIRGFDTIKTAAGVLAEHGFTAAPVVDEDGVLIGILAEADLIRDDVRRSLDRCSGLEQWPVSVRDGGGQDHRPGRRPGQPRHRAR